MNIQYDEIYLTATFYKKMERIEKTIDRDGKETIISFDYYLYQDFSFHYIEDRLFLVINEPNRYTKYFIEFINTVLRMKVTMKNKSINLNRFISRAKELKQFQVLKARFNELALSQYSKGSLEVTSTKNAIMDFEKIFGNIYYDLSKVKISYFDEYIYIVELSKTGLVFLSKHSNVQKKTTRKLIDLLYLQDV